MFGIKTSFLFIITDYDFLSKENSNVISETKSNNFRRVISKYNSVQLQHLLQSIYMYILEFTIKLYKSNQYIIY